MIAATLRESLREKLAIETRASTSSTSSRPRGERHGLRISDRARPTSATRCVTSSIPRSFRTSLQSFKRIARNGRTRFARFSARPKPRACGHRTCPGARRARPRHPRDVRAVPRDGAIARRCVGIPLRRAGSGEHGAPARVGERAGAGALAQAALRRGSLERLLHDRAGAWRRGYPTTCARWRSPTGTAGRSAGTSGTRRAAAMRRSSS